MSTGSISDALSRVSAIQQQLQQLGSGAMLDSALGVSGSSTSSTGSTTSDASTSTDASNDTDFADALASAEGSDASSDGDGDSALSSTDLVSGGVALDGSSGSTSVALPSQASTLLTSNQQQFASTLSADTGLSPSVVSSWLLAEESGSAAQTRQAAGNNDWLNVGYTGSGTYGASDAVWSDPTTAAAATASWLQGQDSISGYGTASSAIQAILSSVGQSPTAQIQAIQNSGWSSTGYPSLTSLYQSVAAG